MSTDKFTVLTASNYSAWATQMKHILSVHDVWDVVSGDEKEPKEDDPKYVSEPGQRPTFEEDRKAHESKVAKANATVFANMSQPIVEEYKKYRIPSILWETLQKHY